MTKNIRTLFWMLLLRADVVYSLYSSPSHHVRVSGLYKQHNNYVRLFASSESTRNNQISLESSETSVPRHVAFIVDGNGRWAEQRGLSRPDGHTGGYSFIFSFHVSIVLFPAFSRIPSLTIPAGANVTVEIVKAAFDMGVEVVTLYLFSTGQWSIDWITNELLHRSTNLSATYNHPMYTLFLNYYQSDSFTYVFTCTSFTHPNLPLPP